jgi:hypothetical protein
MTFVETNNYNLITFPVLQSEDSTPLQKALLTIIFIPLNPV